MREEGKRMPDDKEVDCAWIDFGQIAGIGRENN